MGVVQILARGMTQETTDAMKSPVFLYIEESRKFEKGQALKFSDLDKRYNKLLGKKYRPACKWHFDGKNGRPTIAELGFHRILRLIRY